MSKKTPSKAKRVKKTPIAKKGGSKPIQKSPKKKANSSQGTVKPKTGKLAKIKEPATKHIGAPIGGGKFGEVCICPGDPLRAKWMAETYLKNAEQITNVRGMLGFTGWFEGVRLTVIASGMGMPSAHIYWHELINMYGVKKIIRTGTCGTTKPKPA